MPPIIVTVDATIGSAIGRHGGESEPAPCRQGGWPVGRGHVLDTLGDDGRPVEVLVLMPEPALPGSDVLARPVAVLHLDEHGRPVDEVVCVADDACFTDLVDVPELARWHAEPDAWAAVLAHLTHQSTPTVTGCDRRSEADRTLAEAHHAFLQLTGCLE